MDRINWLDIIFCILVVPGMMFLFPLEDWLQWHASYVLLYLGWLYLVFLMCRRALGPLLLQGFKGTLTVVGALFLTGVTTFILTLTPVNFPTAPDWGGGMAPHIRAMWILLLAVIAYGVPVGMLATQTSRLTTVKETDEAEQAARQAMEARRVEAFPTETFIEVKSNYRTVQVPLSAIQYLEGRNNYTCFHLDNHDDVVTQIPMKRALDALPEGKFVRIHRSYIVPVWRIEKRTAQHVKVLGLKDPLPIGRAHKDFMQTND